jgi:hypothetical protein
MLYIILNAIVKKKIARERIWLLLVYIVVCMYLWLHV